MYRRERLLGSRQRGRVDFYMKAAEAKAPRRRLTHEELRAVRQALRFPLGRYGYDRAAQLSGVPARTVHHWAKVGALVPDFHPATPKEWSYRDLVFLRLLAWLRARGMDLATAVDRVAHVRWVLQKSSESFDVVRSDGSIFLLGGEDFDRITGQRVMAEVMEYVSAFNLTTSLGLLEEAGGVDRLWGPDLLRPSGRTAIHPSVMGGAALHRGGIAPPARIPTRSSGKLSGQPSSFSSACSCSWPE
jgi:hypothetical protein